MNLTKIIMGTLYAIGNVLGHTIDNSQNSGLNQNNASLGNTLPPFNINNLPPDLQIYINQTECNGANIRSGTMRLLVGNDAPPYPNLETAEKCAPRTETQVRICSGMEILTKQCDKKPAIPNPNTENDHPCNEITLRAGREGFKNMQELRNCPANINNLYTKYAVRQEDGSLKKCDLLGTCEDIKSPKNQEEKVSQVEKKVSKNQEEKVSQVEKKVSKNERKVLHPNGKFLAIG